MAIPLRNARNHSDATFMWVLNRSYRDQCYIQLKRDYTTINIGSICGSPSLTAINEAFGFGEKLLGGYITSLPIQVEEEVKAAVRILHGASPADMPIVESRKEYVVDWNTMTQIGLSKESIPAKYRIINIPFSDKYPLLWGISVASFILILIILFASLWWLYLREQMRKKQALIALADEKETLSLAIEGGMTYAWRLDNGCFVFEDAFWASQGLSPRQLSFKEFMSFIHPDHWEGVKFNWRNLKSAHKKIVQELCNFDGKGYQWWEFRYTTKQLPGGEYKTAGLLLNIQDIKDREEELEAARLLAEKAELKQSFLANMSHEIRTPLNSIVGFANILALEDGLSSVEREEYISTINKNSELLLKLINDILELSRIESGYMSFSFKRCKVRELIDDIYMTHQVLIASHLEFLKEMDDIPLEINVDRERLIQVLTNFLNNACKFTETGYIKLGYSYLPDEGQCADLCRRYRKRDSTRRTTDDFQPFLQTKRIFTGSRIGTFYLSGNYRETGWKDRTQVRGRQGKSLYGYSSLPGGILIMIDFNGNTNNLISCVSLFPSFPSKSPVNGWKSVFRGKIRLKKLSTESMPVRIRKQRIIAARYK